MYKNSCFRYRFSSIISIVLLSLFMLLLSPAVTAENKTQPAGNGRLKQNQPSIGIALGAGGANGLAHILMLEALDEMDIKVDRITGSSIGAIIGSLYASGMSGKEIRKLVEQYAVSDSEKSLSQLVGDGAFQWIKFIEIELGNGGLVSADRFLSFMSETLEDKTFEELDIPMSIVASDLWSREQIVMESGDLISAINASMAIPGVFEPVERNGRILIDGGTSNPVPYDLLFEDCDIVIGIDVIGIRTRPSETPGYFETVFNSVKVMQAAIMNEKLLHNEPDIYISVPVKDIRALEFYHTKEVFEQTKSSREIFRQKLYKAIEKWNSGTQ